MSENTNFRNAEQDKKKNVLIIILIVLLVLSGVKLTFDYLDKEELKTDLSATTNELANTMNKLDSISIQLDMKIAEIQQLGGDVDSLIVIKQQLEKDKEQIRRSGNSQIAALKDKVEGYEYLLKQQDAEIVRLKELNETLYTENVELKTEKNALSSNITELTKVREELSEKVAVASQLKAENIKVFAVNSRGREREGEFRSRQLEKLKVSFGLADNKVAQKGTKDIYVQVIDPNGNVIFDVAKGSGTFMLNGKEEFFTAKQEILFDNTKQQLSYYYEKDSDYEPGSYDIFIFCEGYVIGKETFVVK
ncbi:chromosome segregation protein SMC [Penaeicola halotolerans]|uniref:chromosome segregation protein SMC n=1 Tax=Penaeicola halotolerans TaxID=2793196 RepID=UPI001CF862FD|nr:chromosome segregation protein SMC [Penaeicola halotolerans]